MRRRRPNGLVTAEQVFRFYMPGAPPPAPSLTEGCWDWTGTVNRYGYIHVNGTHIGAHRVSYEIFVGPIPDGLGVLHTCDRPICVQPVHLYAGSQAENVRDATDRGRAVPPPTGRGSANGRAKLSEADVAIIRQSTAPTRELAALFGVHRTTIQTIRNGRKRRDG